jgi:hypothetical protein
MQSFFPVRILYVCLTELLCKQVYLDELCFTSVVKKQILSFKVYLKKLFSKKLFSKISLKKRNGAEVSQKAIPTRSYVFLGGFMVVMYI